MANGIPEYSHYTGCSLRARIIENNKQFITDRKAVKRAVLSSVWIKKKKNNGPGTQKHYRI